MASRGFTPKEILLGLLVLLCACTVITLVGVNMAKRDSLQRDVLRMRSLYMSAAMYESDWSGWLPPDLLTARLYVSDDIAYQSTKDPFKGSKAPYPADAGLPGWRVESPVRISYTYLYAFATAGKKKVKPWYELKYDVKVGLIADEWQGAVTAGEGFDAIVSGAIFRLNTDGALHRIDRAASTSLGNFDELFFKQEPTVSQPKP